MCEVTGSKQASTDLPKGGLDSPLYVEEFVDQAKEWNENSPDIVKQQCVYFPATFDHHCNLALTCFGLAILL